MNRDELAARLRGACAAVTAAQDELTEIDSHFGDADHGVTMTKIAQAIAGSIPSAGGIKGIKNAACVVIVANNGLKGAAVHLQISDAGGNCALRSLKIAIVDDHAGVLAVVPDRIAPYAAVAVICGACAA